mmetsp:Transcript_74746/g.118942  ORF Transcript_74746/g.118942 Transcript_74746/m.118942 type:complete len:105 (-) Transcript_74746:893-1207(-)
MAFQTAYPKPISPDTANMTYFRFEIAPTEPAMMDIDGKPQHAHRDNDTESVTSSCSCTSTTTTMSGIDDTQRVTDLRPLYCQSYPLLSGALHLRPSLYLHPLSC